MLSEWQETAALRKSRLEEDLARRAQDAEEQANIQPAPATPQTDPIMAQVVEPERQVAVSEGLANASEQQLESQYKQYSTELDQTIAEQQAIVEKAKGSDFEPASMSAAVDNLSRLRDARARLDEAYRQGKLSLTEYRRQVGAYKQSLIPDPVDELLGEDPAKIEERADRTYANQLYIADTIPGPIAVKGVQPKYRPIPGPAAGPRPGSIGAGIQRGFTLFGEAVESKVQNVESWFGGLSDKARSNAVQQKVAGEDAKAGVSFAASGAASAGAGIVGGATFMLRPWNWGKTFESGLLLLTDEKARGEAVSRVMANPFGTVTYGGGALLGGALFGEAVGKALPERVTVKTSSQKMLARDYKYKVMEEKPSYRLTVEKLKIKQENIPQIPEDFSSSKYLMSARGMGEWPESGKIDFGSAKGFKRTGADLLPLDYVPEGVVTEVESYRLLRIDPVRAYEPKLSLPKIVTTTTRTTKPMFGNFGETTSIVGLGSLLKGGTQQGNTQGSLLKTQTSTASRQSVNTQTRQRPQMKSILSMESLQQSRTELLQVQHVKQEQRTVQRVRQEERIEQGQKQKQQERIIAFTPLRRIASRSTSPLELSKKKKKKREAPNLFGREKRSYRLLDPEDILR